MVLGRRTSAHREDWVKSVFFSLCQKHFDKLAWTAFFSIWLRKFYAIFTRLGLRASGFWCRLLFHLSKEIYLDETSYNVGLQENQIRKKWMIDLHTIPEYSEWIWFRLVLLYYFTALLNIYTVCTLALNNYRKSYKLTNYMYCLKSYQQFHYIWCFLSISSAKNQERILWHSLADSIVVWLPRNPSNGCHLLLQILPQGNMARWYWW